MDCSCEAPASRTASINVVTGFGPDVVPPLVEHPLVRQGVVHRRRGRRRRRGRARRSQREAGHARARREVSASRVRRRRPRAGGCRGSPPGCSPPAARRASPDHGSSSTSRCTTSSSNGWSPSPTRSASAIPSDPDTDVGPVATDEAVRAHPRLHRPRQRLGGHARHRRHAGGGGRLLRASSRRRCSPTSNRPASCSRRKCSVPVLAVTSFDRRSGGGRRSPTESPTAWPPASGPGTWPGPPREPPAAGRARSG